MMPSAPTTSVLPRVNDISLAAFPEFGHLPETTIKQAIIGLIEADYLFNPPLTMGI